MTTLMEQTKLASETTHLSAHALQALIRQQRNRDPNCRFEQLVDWWRATHLLFGVVLLGSTHGQGYIAMDAIWS